jgi:DNA-directed RNA polymerase specialized sigma24 family protein
VNVTHLLFVLVDMAANTDALQDVLGGDPDAVISELYSDYAKALHGYVEQFCPDRTSADDIVQETFIRAWRHLPQLSADDRPVRPWLFRVAQRGRLHRSRPAGPGSRPVEGWAHSGRVMLGRLGSA